jgi:hypothetical protein
LFALHKIISKYTEKIYVYIEKTQRVTTLRISRLIMVQHEIFLDPYFLYKMGWTKPKNHFTLLFFSLRVTCLWLVHTKNVVPNM